MPRLRELVRFHSVRRRLIFGNLLALFVAIGLGGLALSRLLAVRGECDRIANGCLPSIHLIHQIDTHVGRVYGLTVRHALVGDGPASKQITEQIKDEVAGLNSVTSEYQSSLISPRQRRIFNRKPQFRYAIFHNY